MTRKRRIQYRVIWFQPGQPSFADVSFTAISDHHAWLMAEKIGRELRLSATWRRIECRDDPAHTRYL